MGTYWNEREKTVIFMAGRKKVTGTKRTAPGRSDAKMAAKRLYRSHKDKKIAGVCGGVAEYLDVDSTIIRLLFLVFALLTAVVGGVFLYLAAWAIMPSRLYHNCP